MDKPEINSLYKYRAFNQYSLQLIIDEIAWFALPKSFNDPFDCALNVDSSRLEENVLKAFELRKIDPKRVPLEEFGLQDMNIEAFKEFQNSLETLLETKGIFSLSEVNNEILMWAHYADRHTGFAIEYERNPSNILGTQAQPVQYQQEIPSLTIHDIMTDGGRFNELWLTKSEHWSYEKEWRVINSKGGKAFNFPCRIKSIVFGMRMREENRWTIQNILKNKDVKYFEAKRSDLKFELEIHELA